MSYISEARSDAASTALEYIDTIMEFIKDGEDVSDDLLNDYPDGDSYHHENHVDREYDLEEAATVLKELREHKETDSGLWEGLEPEQAISAQAPFTYGNAVMANWQELIEYINDDEMIQQAKELFANYLGDDHWEKIVEPVKELTEVHVRKLIGEWT